MTNSWTDIGNSTFVVVMGANPSENHPACMAHINRARTAAPKTLPGGQTSNKPAAEMWVIDPRKTRTAALADRYIRIRPGTDIAFINGVVRYIIEGMETGSDFTASQKTKWVAHHNRSADNLLAKDDSNVQRNVSGRSKYNDARLLVKSDGSDYLRDVRVLDASGNTVSNLPNAGWAYNGSGEATVFNKLRTHVAPYTQAAVATICGCNADDIRDVARKFVDNSRFASVGTDASGNANVVVHDPTNAAFRSTTMLYAMGLTQHTCGSQNVKSFALIQDLLGNNGRAGGGINALRGIHNVQGSTDMGLLYANIPAYSGNPATQPWEDSQAFGKYMDALYGIRLSGNKYSKATLDSAAANSDLYFVAKAAGVGGNSISVQTANDGSGNSTAVTVDVRAIRIRLGTDASGNLTATADQVKAAIDGSADASALVGVATQADASGNATGKVDVLGPVSLAGGNGAGYASLTIAGGGANDDLTFSAKTLGTVGNKVSIELFDPGAATAATTAAVTNDYTIKVTLAWDASGSMIVATANAVKAAIAASTLANALVHTSVEGTGAGIVSAAAATNLSGGANTTYDYAGVPNAYTPGGNATATAIGTMGLQQNGFYHMTRRWFADNSGNSARADIDKIYTLWPKVNGTNHIQMFRNMADVGTVTAQLYDFSGNDTAVISPSTTAVKKGIKAGSVVIKNTAETTTYDEGTDYIVNYPGNTFTRVKGGGIAPNSQVKVWYSYGIRAVLCWGQNPAVTEPNQSKVREGLRNLDLLVCVDMFANETAMCDRKAGSITYLIPAASHVEEAGSATNSARVLQWRNEAVKPKGNSRSDIELVIRLAKALSEAHAFQHINAHWKNLTTPMDGSGNLFWTKMYKAQYGDVSGNGIDASGNVTDSDSVASNVYQEMCDKVDKVGGGTVWIYSTAYEAPGTDVRPTAYGESWTNAIRAKNRSNTDRGGILSHPRWGFNWLFNRRVFYNNGDVWKSGTIDAADEGDSYQGPDNCARLYVSNNAAVIDYGEQKYRTIHTLKDVPKTPAGGTVSGATLAGRFPWHTEPYETPYPALADTWGYNSSGTSGNLLLTAADRGTVSTYPLVLTTIRCVEHFQGGPITRNNPANIELEPYPWIEINSQDAINLSISDGDWVKVVTKRTDGNVNDVIGDASGNAYASAAYGQGFKARVGVGAQSNQRVGTGVVAIPWHWGEQGMSTGSRANDVTIDAMDANTTIPEYKACLCRLVKM